jgi:hypothetical protein
MRRLALPLLFAVVAAAGCTDGFPRVGPAKRLTLRFVQGSNPGSPTQRIPLSLENPTSFTFNVEALGRDGQRDLTMNSFVRFTARPGAVVSVTHPRAAGRSVRLETGLAENVVVQVTGSYGDTTIWAEDAGFEPADPLGNPPPQCSDRIDNDGDGKVDGVDEGCAAPNDNTEANGTYASGASDVIFFAFPRIADVRGAATGGGATAFPKQQILIDTGYHPDTNVYDFDVVVTRIASDGFYVTDTGDKRGYSSVFAFNFNPPPRMRVCDRLRSFGGTASDFFGFTEIGYPTWTLEEWQGPQQRPCLVPEPTLLTPTNMDATNLRKVIAGLVRVATQDTLQAHIGKHFGRKKPIDQACLDKALADAPTLSPTDKAARLAACVQDPGDDASNCDVNGDGKVDFNNEPEKTCANKCSADLECTEFSNYDSRSAFRVVVTDTATNQSAAVQANGTTASNFDPVALRGQPLRAFTGTLRFFSGGTQFTIEARCEADIVVDLAKGPLPSDKACVFPRTIGDNNAGTN